MSNPVVPNEEDQKQAATDTSKLPDDSEAPSANEADSDDGLVNDSEEALFSVLEREEEEEEARQAALQPKDITVAPTLLRKALADGDVKADDSEEESDKEKQEAKSPEHHVHARVSRIETRKFAVNWRRKELRRSSHWWLCGALAFYLVYD
jgi:hypothetical protein